MVESLNNKPYYLAQLNDDGTILYSDKTKQFIIEIGSEVRFRLRRGSSVSKDAVLLINKPIFNADTGEKQFTVTSPIPTLTGDPELDSVAQIQSRGSALNSTYLEKVEATNGDQSLNLEFRVHFQESGSFFIQLEYFDEKLQIRNYSQPIYINVEPVLLLKDRQVKCKELSILTVLSRCLGKIDRWEEVFKNISELNYNAIHFTPIQEYGMSYSHYSISDQTIIDDYYFSNPASTNRQQRIKLLKQTVDHIRDEFGLLSIIDIVLNHTANNSTWLLEHPEAAYNTENCPHLNSAYVLDQALFDLSNDFAQGKYRSDCPNSPYIETEEDLKKVMNLIDSRVIKRLNLHEYFIFDIDKTIDTVKQCIQKELTNLDQFKTIFDKKKLWGKDHYLLLKDKFANNHGAQRKGVKLDLQNAAAYFFIENNRNEDRCLKEIKALLTKHNDEWISKVEGFVKDALYHIEGNIRYYKIEQKESKITEKNLLLHRYFSVLENKQQSKVAHNGWIMNHDPMIDFAQTGWEYLRRNINIWGDSVKLRYGKCPEDSPFLWEHMSRYVADMATVFDGFRLDNAHSTPIHVCYYLLQVARSCNPNLFVMAELFTSSAETDAIFVQKLNLNGLVRELQNTYDCKQLGDYFHYLTCREAVLGLIDQDFEDINGQKYQLLKSKKPSDIIYDQTHDNPAPAEKFLTPRIALPFIGVSSLADQPIASTWGYDMLLREKLSVVDEKRLYPTMNQDDLFDIDGEDPNKRSHKRNGQNEEENKEEKQIDFEYLFEYDDRNARSVAIAGTFNEWKPTYQMKKEGYDHWTLKLILPIEGQDKYYFKFVVDEQHWEYNRRVPFEYDNKNNINNIIEIPGHHHQQIQHNSKERMFADIRYARRRLNEIHEECTRNNAEIFLHQQSPDVLMIIRQFQLDYSNSFDCYVSITRHCYYMEGGDYDYQTSVELPGYVSEIVFAGYLEIPDKCYSGQRDQLYIKGAQAKFKVYKDLNAFCRIEKIDGQDKEKLSFFSMPPGFTCVIKTRHPKHMKDSVRVLNQLTQIKSEELSLQLFHDTPITVLNHLLFRCEPEEKEISKGDRGPYGLHFLGQFEYAGIASYMHLFRQLKVSGDMGHELFNNIREGNWLYDYTLNRMASMEEAQRIGEFMRDYFDHVKKMYPSLKPKYGSRVIEKVYNAAVFELINRRMNDQFVNNSGDLFIQRLALAVIQMYGRVPSGIFQEHKDSMSAGLPHFTTGFARCWGRDTFIALKGLFISTGLEEEAKDIIKYFAKVSRHGLIPNLHDKGYNTRFNARDATWFFLQAIKDFVNQSKNDGISLLQETIELHFRDNDQKAHIDKLHRKEPPRTITIEDLIQEILQAHAHGIQFREWNAGYQIDEHMKDEGFNVKISLDKKTGFCFGGNEHNCGTWMDKMGSSNKTNNKGVPATPRDGAPIELVAMQYSVLRFMEDLSDKQLIQHQGVQVGEEQWTFKQWADLIKQNFETCFWVPQYDNDDGKYNVDKKHISRRGIYKDTFRSSHHYTDYQLRPNVCIAMAYAPDLFEEDHARICLSIIEQVLMEPGCMGIKTLDPSDKNYRGDYNNSDDSCGWNYHQGPEWLWPVGFFLKAKIIFSQHTEKSEKIEEIMQWLIPHQKHIFTDKWEGLPELTNSHGQYCHDSCRTQAWSISTILDALRDLYYL